MAASSAALLPMSTLKASPRFLVLRCSANDGFGFTAFYHAAFVEHDQIVFRFDLIEQDASPKARRYRPYGPSS